MEDSEKETMLLYHCLNRHNKYYDHLSVVLQQEGVEKRDYLETEFIRQASTLRSEILHGRNGTLCSPFPTVRTTMPNTWNRPQRRPPTVCVHRVVETALLACEVDSTVGDALVATFTAVLQLPFVDVEATVVRRDSRRHKAVAGVY